MGAILNFVPRAAAVKNARPPDEGVAAIIIFPGVRYERPLAKEPALGRKNAGGPNGEKTGPARH